MKARATQVSGGPGDGGEAFVRERALPAIKAAQGYQGWIQLRAQDDRGISISLWSDDEAMAASDELAAGLRDEAQQQGFELSMIGRFDIDLMEPRAGDAGAARLVRMSGGGDMTAFGRDTVLPLYDGIDGFCGLVAGTAGQKGIGVSLWASDEAFESAQDAMRQVGESMGEAGFAIESADRCTVSVLELPQSATA
jgi:heme-degrading monooxygenase HmoA